jgi:hypothetical protein
MDAEYINLRKGPERDRRLESIVGNIQKASQVEVKYITHHWTPSKSAYSGTRRRHVCGVQAGGELEGFAR